MTMKHALHFIALWEVGSKLPTIKRQLLRKKWNWPSELRADANLKTYIKIRTKILITISQNLKCIKACQS